MKIQCSIDNLGGLEQTDPVGVPFVALSACPVCAGEKLTDVSRLEQSLVTAWCGDCGHMFQRRRPTDGWYANWYQAGWDSGRAKAWRPSAWRSARKSAGTRLVGAAKRVVDRQGRKLMRGPAYDFCRPILERNFSVLDIGCGYGEALKPFAQRGCRVFGIEASPHRALAARDFGVVTANTPVERLAPDTFGTVFDLVISSHVIEHVARPRDFVEGLKRVLRPGGWVCLAAPNLEHDFLLQDFFFALHVHHFSRSSLRTLLAENGFSVERCQEDHELRMLAQYGPKASGHSRLSAVRPIECDPRSVAEGVLGSGFDVLGQDGGRRFCRWRLNASAFERRYDVQYSSNAEADVDCEPGKDRSMTMDWRGPVTLPIEFSTASGPTPFWVK